jgi:tetratricopeptide (TPR) repeat protein
VLLNIARVYLEKKNVQYAKSIAKKSLEMLRELGDKNGQMEALLLLADIRITSKRIEDAKSYAEETIAIAQELKNKDFEMMARRVLGAVAREQGQHRKAVIELTKALRYFQSTENTVEAAKTMWELALLWKRRNDMVHARDNLINAKQIFEEHGMSVWTRKCEDMLKLL